MAVEATRTILLADDEPILARLIARVLRGAGYRVSTAGSAEELLSGLEATESPHVVVLDATLSRRLDDDVLQRLLEGRRPALVIVSGAELDGALAAGLDRGPGLFLAKPFEPAQLLAAIGEVLDAAAR